MFWRLSMQTPITKKKISVPRLILACAIPLAVGAGGAALAGNFGLYEAVSQPPLSPPPSVFPIVWTILYVLMGIASYLVFETRSESGKKALTLYAFYLVLNFLWPLVFFGKGAFLAALFLIAAQIILLAGMLPPYYEANKTAALLILPVLIWSIFALYLNAGVLYLNP